MQKAGVFAVLLCAAESVEVELPAALVRCEFPPCLSKRTHDDAVDTLIRMLASAIVEPTRGVRYRSRSFSMHPGFSHWDFVEITSLRKRRFASSTVNAVKLKILSSTL